MIRIASLRLILAALVTAACGCSIQDVFRSTLGGVNSDQASLNKVNPGNDNSFSNEAERTPFPFLKDKD